MLQRYNFGISKAGIVFHVRTVKGDANSSVGSGTVASYGVGSVEVAINTAITNDLFFVRDSDGTVFGYAEYLPPQIVDNAAIADAVRVELEPELSLLSERLGHSDELPPGPVEFYPDTEGEDFVWVDVFTIDFIDTVEDNVPVTIELINKGVAYAETGFPTTYKETVNSDADGRARFKLAKGSAIRPIMNGATHKGKIKNQTFYLRPADEPGKASKMLVAAK